MASPVVARQEADELACEPAPSLLVDGSTLPNGLAEPRPDRRSRRLKIRSILSPLERRGPPRAASNVGASW
jgi:hypothetical protein